ncbi:hypothetical protein [Bacillus suaedae]|uniref:Uncharacterized protein n=1 Tax=Halalkalibacter suaedae TaxID=2822140 RepID=A0A940WR36_9BACI|nr:hypothetical protein [Bacillus suaedae]MBP3951154.1 hypothetical protein [Bacillus suaedae]
MKTKPLQSFNRAEIALVADSMRRYMFQVSKLSARMILSEYIKVIQKGKDVELDGMGMEYIFSSLQAKANEISDRFGDKKKEISMIRQLAEEVRSKRVYFQQSFYSNPIKKEAPTAGTVSTSILIY